MMAFSRIIRCHTEEEYEKVFKKAGDSLVLVEFVAVSGTREWSHDAMDGSIGRPTRRRFYAFFSRAGWRSKPLQYRARASFSSARPVTLTDITLSFSLAPSPYPSRARTMPSVAMGIIVDIFKKNHRVGARRARACNLT